MTRGFLDIHFVNRTESPMLYTHITGRRLNQGPMLVLQSDGKTAYDLPSPKTTLSSIGVDHAIPIGGPGAERTVRVPQLEGGRIWFSKGRPLVLFVNPSANGGALVEPSAMNNMDQNYVGAWTFCELTFNQAELFVNISFVDFVSIPIGLELQNDTDQTGNVPGLQADGVVKIAEELEKLGDPWKRLIIRSSSGDLIRVLSPNSGVDLFPNLFKSYYSRYIDEVWKKYENIDLIISTQHPEWGVFRGRVRGDELYFIGKFSFSFQKPTTHDILSCNTGPFAVRDPRDEREEARLNVGARITAAFNRSTLLLNNNQPQGERVETYYTNAPINHYSRICHKISVAGRGYAFPYDDVQPTGGADQSGFLRDSNPKILNILVGGTEIS